MAIGDRYKVFVEIDPTSLLPIRILKEYDAYRMDPKIVSHWARSSAVSAIRSQVYDRANGHCERCAKPVTSKQAHMDEKKSRGSGGEISLNNCWILCFECHEGNKPTSEHGDRRLRFGESNG